YVTNHSTYDLLPFIFNYHRDLQLLHSFPTRRSSDLVAPPEKVSGAAFGGIIGYMVILLCMTGAMYPAMDLTAGEKERGTMETILDRKSTRLNSSHQIISYAVFCLKKKNKK